MLQIANDAGLVDSESLGNLSFLVENLENLGVSLNLLNALIVMTIFLFLKELHSILREYI